MPKTRIAVYVAGDPLLNLKLMQGLLRHGRAHPTWSFSLQTRNASAASLRGFDGLLHVRSQTAEVPASVRKRLPYVAVLGKAGEVAPQVTVHDEAVGTMGAAHLAELGLSSLAFCGTDTHWSEARGRGFVAEAECRGIRCETFSAPFSNTGVHAESGRDDTLRAWLASLEPPIGILTAHDRIAARVIDVCGQLGRRVPEDVAVLGVGNHELICEVSPVPISSIDTALDRVAEHAAEELARMLEGETAPDLQRLPPLKVVSRLSTDMLGYGDAEVVAMLRFIRENVTDHIMPQDVTDHVVGSRRTLERRFSKRVGRSIGEEIRLTRCGIAREMLLGTSLPLIDIAVRCGYADLAHFSRQFKQIYKASPSAYREAHGGRRRS